MSFGDVKALNASQTDFFQDVHDSTQIYWIQIKSIMQEGFRRSCQPDFI